MYVISRDNPTQPRLIINSNETYDRQYWFGNPVYTERYNLVVFAESYRLCLINKDKQIKEIYLSDSMISSFCVFNNSPRVLFTVVGERNCFYSINFDSSDLKKIEITLP